MSRLPSFVASTASYERWRSSRIPTLAEDLKLKHEKLAASPFALLRGTYYRYLEQFDRLPARLSRAPATVVVGDLHIENFGTWRDCDGRLVWGINDFDEIDLLPYPVDLVRLAASALLAIEAGHLALRPRQATQTIHGGWRDRLGAGRNEPFVLEDRHPHLTKLTAEATVSPARFAREMHGLLPWKGELPRRAARLLKEVAPFADFRPELRRRTAGVGSLGSRRIVAMAGVSGGLVVREAKQIPGSASAWLWPDHARERGLAGLVSTARGVAADPFRRQSPKWVLRRLAPDATRLDLTALRHRHDELAVLRSMGAEAANVHLTGHERAAAPKRLAKDDAARPAGWLHDAAVEIAKLTIADHAAWVAS